MKKLILSFILGIGFGAFSYAAADKPNNSQTQDPQKEETTKKEKVQQKYDFSLFKFVKPATKKVESDSSKIIPKKTEVEKVKNETSYLYVKPRDFFKFS